jgi:hypothetical protein
MMFFELPGAPLAPYFVSLGTLVSEHYARTSSGMQEATLRLAVYRQNELAQEDNQ